MSSGREQRSVLHEPELVHCPQIKMLGRASQNDVRRKSLPLHYHSGIEVCLLHKGRFDWTIEDRSYRLLSGDCTFTLPWQRHGGTDGVLDAGELVWIIIAPERYERDGFLRLGTWSALPETEQREIGRLLATAPQPYFPADAWLPLVFAQLDAEVRRRDSSRSWRIGRLLDEFLYTLAQRAGASRTQRRNVFDLSRLQQKITTDLTRHWTLDDLARLTGYGKTMTFRLIRSQTGLAPMALVRQWRIDRARMLLRTSAQSITAIALDCGFKSSQQFATAFRRATGLPPGEWRRRTMGKA